MSNQGDERKQPNERAPQELPTSNAVGESADVDKRKSKFESHQKGWLPTIPEEEPEHKVLPHSRLPDLDWEKYRLRKSMQSRKSASQKGIKSVKNLADENKLPVEQTEETDTSLIPDVTVVEPPEPSTQKENKLEEVSSVANVENLLPPEALKTVKLLSKRNSKPIGSSPERPIAPKVIYLKKPTEPTPPPQEPPHILPSQEEDDGEKIKFPYALHGRAMLDAEPELKEIDKKLTQMLDVHREYVLRKQRRIKRAQARQYRFPEMVQTLTDQGIPCPLNEDFGRLQGFHSRWDPQGTVLEYYSPMLRTFIPINMRGRYRGCWNTDKSMQGLNISKIPPKRDALEGFVDRGRHRNIQLKYDEMSPVALDEAHLDYLVEIQAYHSETLPIPIFYDMLHLGMEVANETLRVLVQEDGYPPNDPIFISAQDHVQQLRRKVQMYGALGLEYMESERKGLGEFGAHWLKSRDEIVREIMRAKDEQRYSFMETMEQEADSKATLRREQTETSLGPALLEKSKSRMPSARQINSTMWNSIAKLTTSKVTPEHVSQSQSQSQKGDFSEGISIADETETDEKSEK